MTVALLVLTDGRHEYLQESVRSAEESLVGDITERWMHDDTGNDDYRGRLADEFPDFVVFGDGPRRGFGGTMRHAWQHMLEHSRAEYVFSCEGDFTFNRPVDLFAMQRLLNLRPNLCQVALRRQPWNDTEKAAGGIIEMDPDSYVEHSFMEIAWLEHTNFFTTNPCMYRRNMLSLKWPDGPQSEGAFGLRMKAAGMNFAYMGTRDSSPWVHHIGDERQGKGY